MWFLYFSGRVLFVLIFIISGYRHVANVKPMSAYAKSMGLPAAGFFTVLSGIMIFVGGVMILLEIEMFWGALLILLFLLPAAFIMHAFWKVEDPAMKAAQEAQFMKNISLSGAALMIMFFSHAVH